MPHNKKRREQNSVRGKPFRHFKRWLEEQPPYDIVIDGANVTRLKVMISKVNLVIPWGSTVLLRFMLWCHLPRFTCFGMTCYLQRVTKLAQEWIAVLSLSLIESQSDSIL